MTTEKPSILIADDDADIRASLRELFEDEGFVVETATDGQDAIAQLDARAQLPSLVLLDVWMPKVDGTRVVQHIRRTPRLEKLPILMMTAATAINIPSNVPLIKKPIALDPLLKAVQELCGRPLR